MSHKEFMHYLRKAVETWAEDGQAYEENSLPTAAEWNDLFMLELYEQTKDGRRA